jgi:hypothetical protein
VADALRIELLELLRKSEADPGADFLRDGVKALAQALMEAEVEGLVGAGRHERTEGRTGRRNGYRERDWDTRVGTVELSVPRVREGGYVPTLLEPRKRHPEGTRRALTAVVPGTRTAGVVRAGRLDAAGGRPGPVPGDGRDQQEPGLAHLRRARRGGGAAPAARVPGTRRAGTRHPPALRPLPLRVAGRDVPEGAARRPGGLRGGRGRHRGARDRRAGYPR